MEKELSALDRLRLFLRPPGKGLATFSTGGGYARPLLRRLYGTDNSTQIQSAWEDTLQRIRRVDTALIGIPSDTGAGILRGSNFGPMGIRDAYLHRYGQYPKHVIDVGDIICVPQLLHDSMLSEGQIARTREALYPGVKQALPVSPLSLAEATYRTLLELNPNLRLVVLGGDHSVSWPSFLYCQARFGDAFGILHFDAHSDLMDRRLGVDYCFATWAYHAVRAMRPHHMVQVGIRTSARTKEEWQRELPVTQFWAHEVRGREKETVEAIVAHFKQVGVERIFISNDIDGTDAALAPATGTPEENGLNPGFVKALITRLQREFEIFGGDVVEVAPPLAGNLEFTTERTCLLAADYLHALLDFPKLGAD